MLERICSPMNAPAPPMIAESVMEPATGKLRSGCSPSATMTVTTSMIHSAYTTTAGIFSLVRCRCWVFR